MAENKRVLDEAEIDGQVYQFVKMDVFLQDDVLARLRYIMGVRDQWLSPEHDSENRRWLYAQCLPHVYRRMPGAAGWLPIVNVTNGKPVPLIDMDRELLNKIMGKVLELHYPVFFTPTTAAETEPASPTTAPAAPVALAAVRSS